MRVEPPVHREKRLPLLLMVEADAVELILGLDDFLDTEGVALGVLWPSNPLGNTVLYNLERMRMLRIGK